jgi:hypothetical protein
MIRGHGGMARMGIFVSFNQPMHVPSPGSSAQWPPRTKCFPGSRFFGEGIRGIDKEALEARDYIGLSM